MSELTTQQMEKFEQLKAYLASLGSVAVAFSGGVDSTFLLKTAHEVLKDKCIAVTAISCSFPERERKEAKAFCEKEGIRHLFCESEELSIEGFSDNPPNRCYMCKKELFTKMTELAKAEKVACIAEGSNMDDMGDYRPGLMAVKELGVKSPLRACGLYKEDIRALAKYLGLSVWEKPSFACLSSRFVYGEKITEKKLSMVDQAEQLLLDMGCRQVRVRMHQELARIEVLPEDFPRIFAEENRGKLYAACKEIGFSYVTVDLQGYRTGSMNETLKN
jgi:uncharacterized protein